MEQTPCHGSHLVEEVESNVGLPSVDNTGIGQQAKEGIDLLCRSVGDPPVIEPVSTNPSVALAEIGSDRAGGPNHLVGK